MLCVVPTDGLAEIEPSMAWNPSVVSGLGLVENVSELFGDMHSYLQQSGQRLGPRHFFAQYCVVWWLVFALIFTNRKQGTRVELCCSA